MLFTVVLEHAFKALDWNGKYEHRPEKQYTLFLFKQIQAIKNVELQINNIKTNPITILRQPPFRWGETI